MIIKCLQCDHEYDGSISKDDLGWHGNCPECESSFDVDVPDDYEVSYCYFEEEGK